ncbi:MAG: hypothetical protein WD847_15960 [Pirellulales bacterium]
MRIAIQPDDYGLTPDGQRDASSPRWAEMAKAAGHEVHWVDVFRTDILSQVRGCHGFMWRHAHTSAHRAIATRLLPVLECQLGLCVYPDQNTCRHYDDKIAQWYLLEAAGVPTPRTSVFWRRSDAEEFCRTATYPLVFKLWAGAGSSNVRLVRSPAEALAWVERMFTRGVGKLEAPGRGRLHQYVQIARSLARDALSPGRPPAEANLWETWELHRNYVLFQEFLPHNAFDTRITVIGNRAFGFRRFNREGDFRASGSGRIDHDPAGIDLKFVRLAFDAARVLGTQSCAIDGLLRGDEPVVGEISYTYASWAVQRCPGYWQSSPDGAARELAWHPGPIWPEEAQMEDFLARLSHWPRGVDAATHTSPV